VVATIRDARFVDLIPIRLRRSLADFAKLVELFDGHGVSFVSVTQQFNTTTSMGRLSRTFRSGLQAGRVAAKVDRLVYELLARRKRSISRVKWVLTERQFGPANRFLAWLSDVR
jgi:DNA invertase Pin-like site-specific DNA recombinase